MSAFSAIIAIVLVCTVATALAGEVASSKSMTKTVAGEVVKIGSMAVKKGTPNGSCTAQTIKDCTEWAEIQAKYVGANPAAKCKCCDAGCTLRMCASLKSSPLCNGGGSTSGTTPAPPPPGAGVGVSQCEDNDQGVTTASKGKAPNCAAVVSGCHNPSIGALVRKYCPRTCELCRSCTDDDTGVAAASKGHAPNCAAVHRGCHDPSIGSLVRKYCPHTCELCGGGAAIKAIKTAAKTTHTKSHMKSTANKLGGPVLIALLLIAVGIML